MSITLLDLGTQPLVNNLRQSAVEALDAEQFPLKAICEDDLTIHLDEEVPPSFLYSSYLYRSGTSQPYIQHCKEMYDSLNHLNLETIIDIGGNDGTLLKTFRDRSEETSFWSGVKPKRLINVDFSESVKDANSANNIEYLCGQFNETMDLPKANLIVSTNVFQHTKDLDLFLRGIVKFLDGVWVLEFPYTLTTLATGQFDQFYHEHYYYWLLAPLTKLFNSYGLKIIYLQTSNIHGGSMRLWLTNQRFSATEPTPVIEQFIAQEQQIDLNGFGGKCDSHIGACRQFISQLKGRTAFFGAAAKGCVFLNALEVTINEMPDAVIIDDTKEKQGLFVPGTGFEVVPRTKELLNSCENIVILAHNFADHISHSLRQSFQGNIYTCLPQIKQW
jgi:hypothetical protein